MFSRDKVIEDNEYFSIKLITDKNGVTRLNCYDKQQKRKVPCEVYKDILDLKEKAEKLKQKQEEKEEKKEEGKKEPLTSVTEESVKLNLLGKTLEIAELKDVRIQLPEKGFSIEKKNVYLFPGLKVSIKDLAIDKKDPAQEEKNREEKIKEILSLQNKKLFEEKESLAEIIKKHPEIILTDDFKNLGVISSIVLSEKREENKKDKFLVHGIGALVSGFFSYLGLKDTSGVEDLFTRILEKKKRIGTESEQVNLIGKEKVDFSKDMSISVDKPTLKVNRKYNKIFLESLSEQFFKSPKNFYRTLTFTGALAIGLPLTFYFLYQFAGDIKHKENGQIKASRGELFGTETEFSDIYQEAKGSLSLKEKKPKTEIPSIELIEVKEFSIFEESFLKAFQRVKKVLDKWIYLRFFSLIKVISLVENNQLLEEFVKALDNFYGAGRLKFMNICNRDLSLYLLSLEDKILEEIYDKVNNLVEMRDFVADFDDFNFEEKTLFYIEVIFSGLREFFLYKTSMLYEVIKEEKQDFIPVLIFKLCERYIDILNYYSDKDRKEKIDVLFSLALHIFNNPYHIYFDKDILLFASLVILLFKR